MSNLEPKSTDVKQKETSVEQQETSVEQQETAKEYPVIHCQRVVPGKTVESMEDIEGLVIQLSENGALSPELVPKFIMNMDVAKLPNGRTTIVSARCRNNFIITETISSPSPDTYDEQAAVEICRNKIYSRLWEMLQFLYATAIVTTNTIVSEYNAAQQIPESVTNERTEENDD